MFYVLRKIKRGYYIFYGVLITLFFSCENSAKEVKDFLAHHNLPLGVLQGVHHVYKDSGRVTLRLKAKQVRDFANRKKHPYQEFPKGIHMITYNSKTRDSVSIFGDYALNYQKTGISKIKGNVLVINHKEKIRLETQLMYWDQKRHYYFTQSPFLLITTPQKDSVAIDKKIDTIAGIGFESREDLRLWEMQQTSGVINPKNDNSKK